LPDRLSGEGSDLEKLTHRPVTAIVQAAAISTAKPEQLWSPRPSVLHLRSAALNLQRNILQRRTRMPLIHVKVIEGVLTTTQKNSLITKLTDAMVSIEGENLRPVTWVVIEEIRSGEWGIGGQPLTTEGVHALIAGRK
jgi:4-oxalocrotonate tautomerase